jgi:hypothetical protein
MGFSGGLPEAVSEGIIDGRGWDHKEAEDILPRSWAGKPPAWESRLPSPGKPIRSSLYLLAERLKQVLRGMGLALVEEYARELVESRPLRWRKDQAH